MHFFWGARRLEKGWHLDPILFPLSKVPPWNLGGCSQCITPVWKNSNQLNDYNCNHHQIRFHSLYLVLCIGWYLFFSFASFSSLRWFHFLLPWHPPQLALHSAAHVWCFSEMSSWSSIHWRDMAHFFHIQLANTTQETFYTKGIFGPVTQTIQNGPTWPFNPRPTKFTSYNPMVVASQSKQLASEFNWSAS